jgi:hypothetical protein
MNQKQPGTTERIAESLSKLETKLETTNDKLTDLREGVGIVSVVIEEAARCL